MNVPKKNSELKVLLGNILVELEQERRKTKKLQLARDDYAQQLAQMTSKMPKIAKNAEMEAKISGHLKNDLFRTVKFLTDEDQISDTLDKFYDLIYTSKEQERLGEDHQHIWKNTYKASLTTQLNAHRSYVQNRMKESWKKFHEENKWIPSVEQFKKCALRTINMEDDDEVKMMEWYITDLLSKCPVVLAILPTIFLPD